MIAAEPSDAITRTMYVNNCRQRSDAPRSEISRPMLIRLKNMMVPSPKYNARPHPGRRPSGPRNAECTLSKDPNGGDEEEETEPGSSL